MMELRSGRILPSAAGSLCKDQAVKPLSTQNTACSLTNKSDNPRSNPDARRKFGHRLKQNEDLYSQTRKDVRVDKPGMYFKTRNTSMMKLRSGRVLTWYDKPSCRNYKVSSQIVSLPKWIYWISENSKQELRSYSRRFLV